MKNFLASITRNGISLAGTALALASLILIISLFLIQQLPDYRGRTCPPKPCLPALGFAAK